MELLTFTTVDDAAAKAFDIIKEGIEKGSIRTLGLATGGTPLKFYEKFRQSKLDVSNISTVNLDEYVGLKATDEHSYHSYMNTELFSHMNFKESFLPNGMAEDLEKECLHYESILQDHPVDVQILGIGENGHIGFNEPGTSFDSLTHVVELTESTREANKRFFEKEEDVPTHALSMGIQSIMAAKKIILLAFGANKAEAVKRMLEGSVDESCPASVLQKHPNVVVLADTEAASLLKALC
ncbi:MULTISPECIES: glucosamine-6-phosphate deaminase [Heyndrickxia]|jgi:glucosamine-6-phosphate deaminase|uniref:glucosamine-6-phosphate deaminase n=1 Tax=Heyndrickxia TaxID=2837504 RepID=UPI000903EC05|nr:glucosamine-6-phosphate deaminase [Heyndrickxia oleronia]NYV68504.1 glucosamine-6-phosphate deaminase [Bacillus sp. Gen3]OJH20687.1 glucosamine-6-phosphate deaminase [Bacillus obstructivus]MCI1588956.1 glucosamine-6-phosphate deaminase [Heyndrickxia oleronia]MCI1611953.1 glucosamine-6-phosphate deaminase [Heyndrickxia oleronia]MCI1743041.1 glucosamine-6-phosphate deaminase [Heyndrickxia oleronia]